MVIRLGSSRDEGVRGFRVGFLDQAIDIDFRDLTVG